MLLEFCACLPADPGNTLKLLAGMCQIVHKHTWGSSFKCINKQLHTEKYTIQRSKCCFSSGENKWKVCCLSCGARCPQLAIVCHRALLLLWVNGKPAALCIVLLYLSTQSALKPAVIFLNKIFTYSNLANMLPPWQTSLLVHWIFKLQNISTC